MSTGFNITKKEYNSIVEGHTLLSLVISRLEEVLHPTVIKDLFKVQELIMDGISNVKREEERQFDENLRYFEKVRQFHNFASIWSIFEVMAFSVKHPYTGITTLVYYDGLYKAGILGETWLDLYKAADECIKLSSDYHHIYIEGFTVVDLNGEKCLSLTTGS